MAKVLRIGISPCPNDTFIFHALVHGLVRIPGYETEFVLKDVEELNALAGAGGLDVCKISCAAYAGLADEWLLLRAGGALGRGCGPVLVAGRDMDPAGLDGGVVAVPGLMTTANLLFGLFAAEAGVRCERRAMVFDRVMDAVASGVCRAGVLIHEGRFTFASRGLRLVADLGAWWEREKNLPIPLGSIAAKRSLGLDTMRAVNAAVRASLEYAREHPEASRAYIREHARELDEAVTRSHIDMFVTDYSLDAGEEGERAVSALAAEAARTAGIEPPGACFAD